jgi:hypothetical protein
VISQISAIGGDDGAAIVKRALSLAAAFAYRSGGTAAEFFTELPQVTSSSSRVALDELFTIT